MIARGRPRLRELLEPFREQESKADLALIVDRPDCIKALAIWPTINWEWDTPEGNRPLHDERLWGWLWKGGRWDIEAMATAMDLTKLETELVLSALAVARVIYPDCTISKPAKELVDAYVRKMYPRTRKPWTPKPKLDELIDSVTEDKAK